MKHWQRHLAVALAPALGLAAWASAQERPAQRTRPAARTAPAQQPQQKTQDDYIALRDEKLAKEVFQKAPWVKDYDEARAQAKSSGKPIFAYFTRSYAA